MVACPTASLITESRNVLSALVEAVKVVNVRIV